MSCVTQDAEGRASIHVAISNQHSVIIQLLISHPDIRLNLRDRQGMTPFACAMTHKNNKAAEAILKREPGAAEQVRATHTHTLLPLLAHLLQCSPSDTVYMNQNFSQIFHSLFLHSGGQQRA